MKAVWYNCRKIWYSNNTSSDGKEKQTKKKPREKHHPSGKLLNSGTARAEQEGSDKCRVWLHWIFLSKAVFMLEIMQNQSCITEDCNLNLKTTNSWNRNSEPLPKHLSIMLSSHIPNVLCYRILFFHLWWTPRVQSKQSDMVKLAPSPSPLSYF